MGRKTGLGRHPHVKPWTDEEVDRFDAMRQKFVSVREIAETLGKTFDQVASRVQFDHSRRARELAQKAAKDRSCLRCGGQFRSEGAHHRLCDNCRDYASRRASSFER